ncbi:MAG: hypothetical protein ABL997_13830 [Planctomycetota bacterium]
MQIPLLVALGLLLQPSAAPDKFWTSMPQDGAIEGQSPSVVEGVLLDEDATHYHVRIAGGEIWLPKARVVRVEKDDLTVEAIAAAVQAAKDARADAEKAEAGAGEAETTRDPVAVVEADAKPRVATPVEAAVTPAEPAPAEDVVEEPRYDPIRGRFGPSTAEARSAQLRELEATYAATKDRDVLKQLRQLRRMR